MARICAVVTTGIIQSLPPPVQCTSDTDNILSRTEGCDTRLHKRILSVTHATLSQGKLSMPRLFVAIDLPERIKDDITATYIALPGARWMDEPQLHLTLRFIGEIDGAAAEAVDSGLRAISGTAFTLAMKNVGFFPPRKAPRILWAGCAESDDLMRLQAKIERAVVSAGIERDGRKFHPHVTVARLSGTPPQKVADYVTANSLFLTEPFMVSSFHLYSSTLHKEGAHHVKEKSYPLNGVYDE
ncbi:MAG: RNA 2',3'-cyclic phosphodiesterase [Chitinispirillaceae bacterium]|nr:RNA 2',3'-cyclic phosphodiesterase [Chitinispirillaceae bacterium]